MSRKEAIELLKTYNYLNYLTGTKIVNKVIELLESEPEQRCKRCNGTGKIWVEMGAMCGDAEIKCPDCKNKSEK